MRAIMARVSGFGRGCSSSLSCAPQSFHSATIRFQGPSLANGDPPPPPWRHHVLTASTNHSSTMSNDQHSGRSTSTIGACPTIGATSTTPLGRALRCLGMPRAGFAGSFVTFSSILPIIFSFKDTYEQFVVRIFRTCAQGRIRRTGREPFKLFRPFVFAAFPPVSALNG